MNGSASAPWLGKLRHEQVASLYRNGFVTIPVTWAAGAVLAALDVDTYMIGTGHFTEEGAGVFNLIVPESGEERSSGTGLLLAGFVQDKSGRHLHSFAEYNFTWMGSDSMDLAARFQAAPAGVADFTASSPTPKELRGGRIGIEALTPVGAVRLEYEHREGDGFDASSTSIKARFGF